MKKSVVILSLVLVLMFMFTVTASATKPTHVSGWFTGLAPDGSDPYWFSFTTADGSIVGLSDQPVKPGLAQRGTVELTFNTGSEILVGTCEYNLRTYDLDGIARIVANRCTGELSGFHMKGVGWAANGLWEGSYHFHP